MLSKHEIVTNILPNKAQIQLHGYIFLFCCYNESENEKTRFIPGCIPPHNNH